MTVKPRNYVCLSKNHGKHNHHAYRKFNCRCPETLAFMADYQRERRRRAKEKGPAFVDATATHRMIRALMAAGWTGEELSAKLGKNRRTSTREILESGRVYLTTHNAISALYDALQNVPGPSRLNVMRSRHKGWAPPFAWDDITDPEAVPTGLEQGRRRYGQRLETMWEYREIRESGMSHAFALRELGLSEEAFRKLLQKVNPAPKTEKKEPEPTRRATRNVSLTELEIAPWKVG